ncbi:lysozyme inhibitor LprI family protein [Profundibacter amoris]|nr:lysozyme inhibitor LprI family protein [Profundibacter amoris]
MKRTCLKYAAYALLAMLPEAGAVAAQELVFSMQATDACIADSGHEGNTEQCIGVSANLCMERTNGGQSTAGMVACMGAELEAWDQRLNAAYAELMAREKAEDKEMADLGSAAPKQSPALLDMQRKWIAYRDARCNYIGAQWGGGSGTGPAVQGCHMVMTGKLALFLQQMLTDY